jgi:acetyl-CoA acetyltransferase
MLAGFPVTVPAVSINRMCGSSQQAVHFAAQAIAAGDMTYCGGLRRGEHDADADVQRSGRGARRRFGLREA